MTIRMITAWSGYNTGDIVTLSSGEETRLVGLGLATTDLDGDVTTAKPVMADANPVTGGSIKTLWVGTQAQYDAIVTKDANTQYNTDAGIYVGDTLVSGGGGSSAIGGSISGATAGSVLFVGSGGVLAQNNANLFWDAAHNQLFAPAFVQKQVNASVGVNALEFGVAEFSGVSNPLFFLGYNHINAVPNHPQFYMGLEGYYYEVGNNRYWSEFYFERRDTGASVSYRPFSVGTYDGHSETAMAVDMFAVSNRQGTKTGIVVYPDTGEIVLGDTATIYPLGNNRYPYAGRTTNNTYLGLIGIDSTNSVIVGESNAPVKIGGQLRVSGGIVFQSASPDVGLVRDSAGVIRLSDGSSGYGKLNISRLECGFGDRIVFRKADGTEIGNIYNSSGNNFRILNAQATGQVEIANSSGNVSLAIKNDQTIEATSSIKTGAPSGGTAAAWKFGVAASVSPTAPNRTVQLDIDGTTYFLAAKTTND